MKRDPASIEAREHDVLVVGGGIAGAWLVWEAASRGLNAALIECADFGQASSWSSLKTAHGGLRHLQRLDLPGFRESVRERRALLRVAPEIVRPLGFAIPADAPLEQLKYFVGGVANDVLSFDRNEGVRSDRRIGSSRLLSAEDLAQIAPKELGWNRAFLWYDAQIAWTERLLMAILHTADEAGAAILNHCLLETATPQEAGFDLIARDSTSGRALKFRAKAVVNAAGSQIEAVARLFGDSCGVVPLIRGANVVVGRDITPRVALGARDLGRFLFLSPWKGLSILGTAYDDGAPPLEALVGDLIESARRAFPWAEISDRDTRAVHSGHVPGRNGEPIYRSRIITHSNPRLLSILTAKYTTARATAEAAIDRAGAALGLRLPPSRSALTELPLARPLGGSLQSQMRAARDGEMATEANDAIRGRLEIGARGASEAEGRIVAEVGETLWPSRPER